MRLWSASAAPRSPGRFCAGTPATVRHTPGLIGHRLRAGQRKQRSLPAGGFTFPEDPAQSCAAVQPVWSAAVDPYVLLACVSAIPPGGRSPSFDLGRYSARVLRDINCEYILIKHLGAEIRLDLPNGTLGLGPVSLCFQVKGEPDLLAQIEALRAFHALSQGRATRTPPRARGARQLLALQAFDARSAGHSLRATSHLLFGLSDWPGRGEHRKSRVRRLVAAGEALVRAGPSTVLREALVR